MSLKITSLVGLGLSTLSFVAWGGFEANKNFQYNSKMKKYEQWRKEFFKKGLYDENHMCKFSYKNECLSDEKIYSQYKQYLPSPYEEVLWNWLYESLKINNEEIRQKQIDKTKINYEEPKEQLPKVKNSQDLKDHCYKEVKKSIDEANKPEKNTNYFHVAGDDNYKNTEEKAHNRCALSIDQLKKLI